MCAVRAPGDYSSHESPLLLTSDAVQWVSSDQQRAPGGFTADCEAFSSLMETLQYKRCTWSKITDSDWPSCLWNQEVLRKTSNQSSKNQQNTTRALKMQLSRIPRGKKPQTSQKLKKRRKKKVSCEKQGKGLTHRFFFFLNTWKKKSLHFKHWTIFQIFCFKEKKNLWKNF